MQKRVLVLDFDGVLTDNTVWCGPDGEEWVRCNRSDSYGLSLLKDAGVGVIVLSTEAAPVVRARCTKLKVAHMYGIADKRAVLEQWMMDHRIDPQSVVYVGNDLNDLPCFQIEGINAVAVADAHNDLRRATKNVTIRRGGHGAVREVCDAILDPNFIWDRG